MSTKITKAEKYSCKHKRKQADAEKNKQARRVFLQKITLP